MASSHSMHALLARGSPLDEVSLATSAFASAGMLAWLVVFYRQYTALLPLQTNFGAIHPFLPLICRH